MTEYTGQQHRGPLIFCNSFPDNQPIHLTIGPVVVTAAGDARTLEMDVHTPFKWWDKKNQEEKLIEGTTKVWCKLGDPALDKITSAFGSKNTGDSVTLTRSGPNYTATGGAARPTTAQAIKAVASASSETYTSNPTTYTQKAPPSIDKLGQAGAHCISIAKWAILDVNEIADVKPETIIAFATTLFIAGTRSGTICPEIIKEAAVAEAAVAEAAVAEAAVEETDDLPF